LGICRSSRIFTSYLLGIETTKEIGSQVGDGICPQDRIIEDLGIEKHAIDEE